jgi:flagellar protein FlaG
MSANINKLSMGGVVNSPSLEAPRSNHVKKSDQGATVNHAPKVVLQTNSQTSLDPTQTRNNVKEAVNFLNDQLSANSRGIGFTVNEGNSTPIVTVRNTKTGEVVRQIPNDVVLKIAQNIDSAKGSFEDKKV